MLALNEPSSDGFSTCGAPACAGEEPEPVSPAPPAAAEGGAASQRDLRASLGDGIACSVMVGLGENYLPAFVLALQMGEVAAGLMASVPILGGAVLQLASPWAVRRLRSHRRWVVACSAAQAASLLLLPLAAIAGSRLGWLAFVAATCYWGSGLAAGPAWTTWIEELVPAPIRARFFASRARFCQMAMMIGFVLGGLTLQYGAVTGRALAAFASVFVLAAASRFVSVGFLAAQSETGPTSQGDRSGASPADRGVPESPVQERFFRLLAYLLAIQIATYISGPYFTPYMLSVLKLSYLQYAFLIALAYLSKAVLLPWWGRVAQRTGARRLLWIGGLGIVPVSGLWFVADGLGYLAAVQVLSGVFWGAYELAMLLMFFETIPKRQRLRLLTIYNVGNSVAMVAGSLLGAAMLQAWGGGRQAYWLLFVLSSAARAASLLLLQVRDRRAAGTLPMSRAATPVVARAAGINALPSPRSSAPVPLNDAA